MVGTKIDTTVQCLSSTCVCHTVVLLQCALCVVHDGGVHLSDPVCHGGGPSHYWKTRLKGAICWYVVVGSKLTCCTNTRVAHHLSTVWQVTAVLELQMMRHY